MTTPSTVDAVPETATAHPFRMFAVQVAAVQTLCPSVRRVTFTGDDLDRFAELDHVLLRLPNQGPGLIDRTIMRPAIAARHG